MQAEATPSPADRAAFANQLAEVEAMDAKGEYTKQLNELEVEYQFTLLRSLDLFHKDGVLPGFDPGFAVPNLFCALSRRL